MTLVLALVLAAAPMKLGMPGLASANLDRQLVVSWETHFAQQLALKGNFVVTTAQDVAQLLGAERQRALLGCADTCTVELANALGVDAMVLGNLSKTSAGFLLNLKIVDARDGHALLVFSGRPANEAAALDLLEQWASEFAVERGGRKALPAPSRAPAFITGGVGVASIGVGAVLLGLAAGVDAQIQHPPPTITPTEFQALQPRGLLFQTTGLILVGVGAAAAITAAVLFATAPRVALALVVTPGGGALGLFGRLP